MRITRIEAHNFLCLRHATITPGPGLTLIAGGNFRGKSALLEAICYALDPDYKPRNRRTLKSLEDVITTGAKAGYAEVALDDGGPYRRELRGGKHSGTPPSRVDHLDLLLTTNLAALSPDVVRERVLAALGGRTSVDVITGRLKERQCDRQKVAEIEPLLVGGRFAPAIRHCEDAKKAARGGWEATTGERFGAKKAIGWRPRQDLPAKEDVERRLAELREEERELDLRTRLSGSISGPCPCCGEQLAYFKGAFVAEKDLPKAEDDPREAMQRLTRLRESIQNNERRLAVIESGVDLAEKADQIYQDYCAWNYLAEALGPEGVQADLWGAATAKLRAFLDEAAAALGFRVSLEADGEPRLNGRPHGLLSESEQWRVHAVLRVALARLTGIGVAAVDRFDVLEPAHRPTVLQWLIQQADGGAQLIVAGTFKAPPKAPGAEVVWLQDGATHHDQESAA